jgi:hypothetical protein
MLRACRPTSDVYASLLAHERSREDDRVIVGIC